MSEERQLVVTLGEADGLVEPKTFAEVLIEEEEKEQRATNLELFLDLAFIFAVSQITGILEHEESWSAIGKATVMGWLMWWLWSQFSWLGSIADLGEASALQVMTLSTIPFVVITACSMQNALEEGSNNAAIEFAGTYFLTHAMCVISQGFSAHNNPDWYYYGPLSFIAPSIILGTSFVHDVTTRAYLWAAVGVFQITTTIASFNLGMMLTKKGTDGEREQGHVGVAINPFHFPERHALFVIIALGEIVTVIAIQARAVLAPSQQTVIPADATGNNSTQLHHLRRMVTSSSSESIGGGADDTPVASFFSVLLSVFVTCFFAAVLWWGYFGYVLEVIAGILLKSKGAERSLLARDMYSFLHFPFVFSIIIYGVVAYKTIEAPFSHLPYHYLFILGLSLTLYQGSLLAMQYRAGGGIRWIRVPFVIVSDLIIAFVGYIIPAVATISVVAVLQLAICMYTFRLYTSFVSEEKQKCQK